MSSFAVQPRPRVSRIAGAAVERARLTVVPRRRGPAARVPFVTLVSLVLVGGVVGLLLFNTSMQQASFAATALQAQATALAAREQTLLMELEDLREPQRVALEARAQGMVPAATPAFLRLPDGRVLGTPVPASPADALRIEPRRPPKPLELTPRRRVVVPPPSGWTARPERNNPGDTAAASAGRPRAAGRNGGTVVGAR